VVGRRSRSLCDGVEGETGKVDEGSATILATSRKEGDVKGDTATKPEVETIAMFEGWRTRLRRWTRVRGRGARRQGLELRRG
jgi:hypothetical protein